MKCELITNLNYNDLLRDIDIPIMNLRNSSKKIFYQVHKNIIQ